MSRSPTEKKKKVYPVTPEGFPKLKFEPIIISPFKVSSPKKRTTPPRTPEHFDWESWESYPHTQAQTPLKQFRLEDLNEEQLEYLRNERLKYLNELKKQIEKKKITKRKLFEAPEEEETIEATQEL